MLSAATRAAPAPCASAALCRRPAAALAPPRLRVLPPLPPLPSRRRLQAAQPSRGRRGAVATRAMLSTEQLVGLAIFFSPSVAALGYAYWRGKGNLQDGLSHLLTAVSQVRGCAAVAVGCCWRAYRGRTGCWRAALGGSLCRRSAARLPARCAAPACLPQQRSMPPRRLAAALVPCTAAGAGLLPAGRGRQEHPGGCGRPERPGGRRAAVQGAVQVVGGWVLERGAGGMRGGCWALCQLVNWLGSSPMPLRGCWALCHVLGRK